MLRQLDFWIEIIGWISTVSFLISIVMPQRLHLHAMGLFTSITTGIYAYHHGATAIWVKWLLAFFFHFYMIIRTKSQSQP
jgi:hypothetical protein